MTTEETLIKLHERIAVLEAFRDFAQPVIINANRLWDAIHAREGLRDYFKLQPHHSQILVDLGKALDAQVKPITDLPVQNCRQTESTEAFYDESPGSGDKMAAV